MKLLHDLIRDAAQHNPDATALRFRGTDTHYGALYAQLAAISGGLVDNGLKAGDRVAVYLPKQPEAVISFFATTMAGGAFVPINPQLKPGQVSHILRDSGASVLVTTADRATILAPVLSQCPDHKTIVLCDNGSCTAIDNIATLRWQELLQTAAAERRVDNAALAALLYTSGSTGHPKGVMLSHRNLLSGAASVSEYLHNNAEDRLLTVLPFSFDYGFSQLSTAFYVGASVVLFEYLLARDVIRTVEKERISGLACVPPVWLQLARLQWPETVSEHLRYLTNSGGAMPVNAISELRRQLPRSKMFLMYGLTEAFRSTYLDPELVVARPTSIGKAVPNATITVVRPDGSLCEPDEPGELVHSGPLVAMGYWNDPKKTAERFRPSPTAAHSGEIAVWSGDTVVRDEDGFLYFVGRRDDMIKTSGYRVSPTEIEEVLYDSGQVAVAVAIAVPHPALGQAIVVVAVPASATGDTKSLLAYCREKMANYMIPVHISWQTDLPRTASDKIDRQLLLSQFKDLFAGITA